ncbi:MAG TPA: 50S ribosomal protein L30 [Anaerolineales bacterium]
MAKTSAEKTIKVTLVRSPIGFPVPQKATLQALGLRHINQTVEHKDTPAMRGMLNKVVHLIRVEE